MEPDRHDFLVGCFILGCVALIIGFSLWLGRGNGDDYQPYRIRFSESVSGLSVGGAVKFRGVDIGKVETIAIDTEDTRFIKVVVRVLKTTPIKADTLASLKMQGVTGVVFVELNGGSANLPDLIAADYAGGIPEIASETSSIANIVNQAPELLQKTSKILDQLNKLISDENVNQVASVIGSLAEISRSFESQLQLTRNLLENSEVIVKDVREATASTKEQVKQVAAQAGQSAQHVNELTLQLRAAAQDIAKLAASLRENPSQVLFPPEKKGVPAP